MGMWECTAFSSSNNWGLMFMYSHQNFPKPPPVGSRVRRGDDWKYGNQDGGGAGTIIKTDGTPG